VFRAQVLIIRWSKLHYTASGIITLKQVSGLKLLKYSFINMSKWQNLCVNFSGVITVYYYKHVTSCRGYVYPVIKLIGKVLCLFTFMYLSNKFNNWINRTST